MKLNVLNEKLDSIRAALKNTELYEFIEDDRSLKLQSPKYIAYRRSKAYRALKKIRHHYDGNKCVKCGCSHRLHLHHLTYIRLFHERLEDVTTLCGNCHEIAHNSLLTEYLSDSNLLPFNTGVTQMSSVSTNPSIPTSEYPKLLRAVASDPVGTPLEIENDGYNKIGTLLRSMGWVICECKEGAKFICKIDSVTHILANQTSEDLQELLRVWRRATVKCGTDRVLSYKPLRDVATKMGADVNLLRERARNYCDNLYERVDRPNKKKNKNTSSQNTNKNPKVHKSAPTAVASSTEQEKILIPSKLVREAVAEAKTDEDWKTIKEVLGTSAIGLLSMMKGLD